LLNLLGKAIRETGQAVDRVGLRAIDKPVFKEPYARHRSVMNLFNKHPWASPDVFVAPNATVVGSVDINTKSSVMYGAVVRGDQGKVDIGAYTTIQERAVVHTSSYHGEDGAGVRIGDYVIIGPGAMLDSCTVESRSKVGAGAVIMEGALVEEMAEVEAGSVVHPGKRIPKGQLWGGNPAVFVRNLTKDELNHMQVNGEETALAADAHADEFLPYGSVYLHAEKLVVVDGGAKALH